MTAVKAVGKNDDLVYDVGMHQGEDSDFYLKKGFRVVGFEADPDLAAQCRRRFFGEIESGQLVVVEGAIVDKQALAGGDKTIRFYKNIDVSVWGTVAE
ncbi:MAG: 16S rRNA A1518/A1519 N6-dimethyltransferase RsmA/KsgA/DIM1 with predicted DNA glycosylase, partial [Paracoccaceae bacterium]